MVQSIIAIVAFLIPAITCSQTVGSEARTTESAVRSIADGILRSSTMMLVDRSTGRRFTPAEADSVRGDLSPESPYNDWRYWNGVLNIAMDALGERLREPSYAAFASKSIAFGFNAAPRFERKYSGQDKWSYPFGQFFVMTELDDCGAMGASVIEVYRKDPQERYRVYIDKAFAHIRAGQRRLDDGTLVRTFPRLSTVWADDLYMGLSFLSRYGRMTGRNDVFDDAARQAINYHALLFDDSAGVMSHCWYSDTQRRGAAFWGRANGWALVAQVELLDHLPDRHPRRDTLIALFRRHVGGIARHQSASGLWHQLLDKPDSFLETSCSSMFTYAIARGVREGYLDPGYLEVARHGWQGVLTRIRSDGQIEGVCAGTVVSEDLAYYRQRPAPMNDVHGIGTVLMAGTEMMKIASDR